MAFELAKLAAPHIRDAWQKCRPFFEGLAALAKLEMKRERLSTTS